MTRKKLETLTDVHEFTNRELLVDMACRLHEMDKKLDVHLALHALANKAIVVGISAITAVVAVIKIWL